MRLYLLSILALTITFFSHGAPARAEFLLNSWRLSSSVLDFDESQFAEVSNTTLEDPRFSEVLTANLANSFATGAHAFNWSVATGQFDTAVHLECQGGSSFRSGSDNLVRFTPSTDVLLTVDAQWQFQLAPGDRSSFFTILVGVTGAAEQLMNHAFGASPVFGDPSAATWTVHDSVLLPAGQEYRFRSIFSLRSFSGSPTALSVGNGFANFSLTSVPCPTALGPLAFAALLIRRPFHRSNR